MPECIHVLKQTFEILDHLRGTTLKACADMRRIMLGIPLLIIPANARCSNGDRLYTMMPRTRVPKLPKWIPMLVGKGKHSLQFSATKTAMLDLNWGKAIK